MPKQLLNGPDVVAVLETHCQTHSHPAFGYFLGTAVGSSTQPAPAA